MAEKEVVEVDNKSEPVLQNEEEDEEEQPRWEGVCVILWNTSWEILWFNIVALSSHDLLLLEDESDEFENIEVPSLQDEDEGRSFITLEFRQRLMVWYIDGWMNKLRGFDNWTSVWERLLNEYRWTNRQTC